MFLSKYNDDDISKRKNTGGGALTVTKGLVGQVEGGKIPPPLYMVKKWPAVLG